jgi:hypothetical protein
MSYMSHYFLPRSIASVVVLPAPLAPRRAQIDPRSMVKLTPWTARTSPKRFETSTTSIAAVLSVRSLDWAVGTAGGDGTAIGS